MIPFLAVDPPPAGVGEWLQVFFWLAGGAAAIVVLVQRMRTPPAQSVRIADQPLEMRTAEELVTEPACAAHRGELKKELEHLHGRISGVREETSKRLDQVEQRMTQGLTDFRRESKADMEGVHARVSDVLRAVSRVEGVLERDRRP